MYHIGGRRLSYHNSGWRWGVGRGRRQHISGRRGVAGRRVAVGVASRWLWRLRHRPEGFAARHGAARAELEQQPTRLSLFLSAVDCGVELRAVICAALRLSVERICNCAGRWAGASSDSASTSKLKQPVLFFSAVKNAWRGRSIPTDVCGVVAYRSRPTRRPRRQKTQ